MQKEFDYNAPINLKNNKFDILFKFDYISNRSYYN